MGFSKIKLGTEEIFEMTVQDGTGKILERWKCMKRDFPKVIKILNKKYSLNLLVKERERTDLDWALR